VLDARRHGVAAFTKGNGFAGTQACNPGVTAGENGRFGCAGMRLGYPLHLVSVLLHEITPCK
jgi:hypothetical protein